MWGLRPLRKMPMMSTTKPASTSIGAMVMRVVLYTSSLLKTLGSLDAPPRMSKKPSSSNAPPAAIHNKFSPLNRETAPRAAGSFVAVAAVCSFFMLKMEGPKVGFLRRWAAFFCSTIAYLVFLEKRQLSACWAVAGRQQNK